MYLGEIVYKVKRETDDKVLIKGINYKTNDDMFNEVLLDLKEAMIPIIKPLAKFLKHIAKGIKFFTKINNALGGVPGAVAAAMIALKGLKFAFGGGGGGGMM